MNCLDCHNPISVQGIRCKSCASIARWRVPGHKLKQTLAQKAAATPESRAKRSLAIKKSWTKPGGRENHLKVWEDSAFKERHRANTIKAMQTSEYTEKQKKSQAIVWSDPERRKRQGARSKKQWQDSKYRRRMLEILTDEKLMAKRTEESQKLMLERWQNKEYRAKMIAMTNANYANPEYKQKHREATIKACQMPEHRQKISIRSKRMWQNEDYAKKIISAAHTCPNKQEKKLDALLQKHYPGDWRYTGSGDVIIGGKSPDFMNCNGRKQVLLFHGIYWHLWKQQEKNPLLTKEMVEQVDKDHYSKYGLDCRIIWEDDFIANPEMTLTSTLGGAL